jgi:hypothetical protein
VRVAGGARWYATVNRPHDDTRDVNHSPWARRCGMGRGAQGAARRAAKPLGRVGLQNARLQP